MYPPIAGLGCDDFLWEVIKMDWFSLVKTGEPILLGKAVVFIKLVKDKLIDKIEKINE